ncbi:MAG: hypothetical protein ABI770_07970 [Sphingomicrobium sp.]
MTAIVKFLAGGVAAAALVGAAPAAAQYYPGYGNPGYGGGNSVGQIINQVFGGGYGGYGNNQQALINQCAGVVQQRLSGGGYSGYGYNSAYGGGYGGGRVLGVSRVEPRAGGGLTVRGVASSGRYAGGYGYGSGYGGEASPDLVWKCRTDYRGYVIGVDVNRAQSNYGYGQYGNGQYNNGYDNDYSQYGYRRY